MKVVLAAAFALLLTAAVPAVADAAVPSGYTFCAQENQTCTFAGTKNVIYGANNSWTAPRVFTSSVACNNATFGDPISGTFKACYTAAAAGDTQAPSVPQNLAATPGNAQVSLSWSASTDNVGVTGYRILRGGTQVGTSTGTTFTNTGLTNGTTYSYTVRAVDAAGNVSADSAAATATPAAPPSGGLPAGYVFCSQEGQTCTFTGQTKSVVYGANNSWTTPRTFTNSVACNNTTFGDPIPGTFKACYTKDASSPPPAACADGIDNDGDGLIDYPADPGCTSATDTDETNAPPPPPPGNSPNGPPGTWALAWSDEFSGTSLDTGKWLCSGATNNHMTNGSLCSNITEGNGEVHLAVDSGTHGAQMWSSREDGAVNGYNLPVGGVAEARVYFPGNASNCNSGIYNWPAFWTSGPNWPQAGEIDVAEALGGQLSVNYHAPVNDSNGPRPSGCWANAFHTFTTWRQASQILVYWDGALVWTHASGDNGAGQGLLLTNGYSGTVFTGDANAVRVDYVRAWVPG